METPIIMNMTFGKALEECVKNGKVICRKNNIKYLITCQVPAIINEDIIPKMTSLNDEIKDILLSTCKRISYSKQMLKININIGEAEQYIPTAEDLFAQDWQIVDGALLEEIKFRFNKEPFIK